MIRLTLLKGSVRPFVLSQIQVRKSSTASPSCPNMVTSRIKQKKKKQVSDSSKSKLKASKLSTDDLHLVISEPENVIHWKKSKEHRWWQLASARVWLTAGSSSSTLLLCHMVRWAVWLKSARDGWTVMDRWLHPITCQVLFESACPFPKTVCKDDFSDDSVWRTIWCVRLATYCFDRTVPLIFSCIWRDAIFRSAIVSAWVRGTKLCQWQYVYLMPFPVTC